jgi:hypothetical protein
MSVSAVRGRRPIGGRVGSAAAVAAVVAALALAAPSTASADSSTTLYVDQSGTATTGCTSPGTGACATINEAVTAAEALTDDVTIDVAASATSYEEDVVIDDFNNPQLTIAGAGASTTTLDGEAEGSDVTINEGTVTISGMTLTDGEASNGGAVDNTDAVTLTDDTLTNNNASDGGGLYSTGTATLTDDTVSDNSATGDGGGVDLKEIASEPTMTATNVTFHDDTAGRGGGVFNSGGFTITGSTFSNDSASEGGGVDTYAYGELDSSTFTDDSASSGDGDGGGVFNEYRLTATGDSFSGDTAKANGGGVDNTGTLTLSRSTAADDSAANGGGVADSEGFVTLTNDTITKDSAGSGYGGGLLDGGSSTLFDDTISADTATNGPGVYVGNTVKLTATILDHAACLVANGATVTDGSFNDESDNTCHLGSTTNRLSNASIDLASLAANGSTGPETLAITSSSSAIDLVPSTTCTATPYDERGDSRPGISGQTSCDAGAYELHLTASKPSAPRSPHAKAGKKSITVSWKAPSSTGGVAITAYHVYCSLKKKVSTKGSGCAKTTGKHLSVTVKKLKANKRYYCVVVATNAKGHSPASKTVNAKTKK